MQPNQRPSVLNMIDRDVLMKLGGQGVLLTIALNMVALVSPLFFTQVYDRVLTTGSIATLLILTAAAIIAIGIGAAFEQVRLVTFNRLSANVYVDLEDPVFRASHAASLAGAQGRRTQHLDDLEFFRATLGGQIPGAALDLIFAPFFVIALYFIHVWLGHFAALTLLGMCVVAALTQWSIQREIVKSQESTVAATNAAESHLRAAEAAAAMGYVRRAQAKWSERNRTSLITQAEATARAGGLNAVARAIRQSAQILIIAIAAHLALIGEVSAGAIIAASIILARLVAPIDIMLGSWRQMAQAGVALQRLNQLLRQMPRPVTGRMPKPQGRLQVDGLTASTSSGAPILRGVSFSVEPGEVLAIVGHTGAGKSTLMRCVMGVWPYMSGIVRLDGAPLTQIDREEVGKWIGFLPQNSDLSPGTIAENIARFTDAKHEDIIAAAQAAGAEPLIATLSAGYNTDVGEAGAQLSAGQRRRIALARALFGAPTLICLDEPEANLDHEGEKALSLALKRMKENGAAVLIAAHRPSAVAIADKVLVMQDGRVIKYGKASEIMPQIVPPAQGAIRQVAP